MYLSERSQRRGMRWWSCKMFASGIPQKRLQIAAPTVSKKPDTPTEKEAISV